MDIDTLDALLDELKLIKNKKSELVKMQEYEHVANLRLEEHKIFEEYLKVLSNSKSIDSKEKKNLLLKFFEKY